MCHIEEFSSLLFESARLDTFIDWPLKWLNPTLLAKEGLYYLGIHDHVACIYCRVIIGSWVIGDIPQHEHNRHSKYCAFIRGSPVGNIPIIHGELIMSLQPPNNNGEIWIRNNLFVNLFIGYL